MENNSIYHVEDKDVYRKPLLDYCKNQDLEYNYFDFDIYASDTNKSFVELIIQDIYNFKPDVVILDLAWNTNEESYFEKLLSDSKLEMNNINTVKEKCQVFKLLDLINLNQNFLPVIIFTLYSQQIRIIFEKIYGKRADYIIKQKPILQTIENYKNLFNNDISKCLEAKIFFNQVNNIFISASLSNINLYSQIMKASAEDINILILGKPGVGKSKLARAIHSLSKRPNGPFIEVDCTTIPKDLMESELFGHEKGSFNGAELKIGKVELANKGTIFLEEIGELSMAMQIKLLKFLETDKMEFYRVGGVKPFSTNVRIIAATNRDLQQEVKLGRFRADLFFRLNIYPIEIPILNDRISDIPLLIQNFYKLFTKKYSKNYRELNLSEIEPFLYCNYHGNVKQLQNIIERAIIKDLDPISLILNEKKTIEELYTDKDNADNNIEELLNNLFEYALDNNLGMNNTLDMVEKHFLEKTLKMCSFNKSAAARKLQLKDDNFRNHCSRLGLI